MALFKLTALFRLERNGWSETWYQDAGDASSAANSFFNYAKVRAKMLAPPAQLEYLRVSDESILGDALVSSFDDAFLPADKDVSAETADAAWSGFLTRWTAQGRQRRFLLLRGAPDDWIRYNAGGTRTQIPAKLSQLFDNLEQSVIANSLGLKVLDTAAAIFNVVAVLTEPATSSYLCTTSIPHNLTGAGRMRCFSFPRSTGMSGVKIVEVAAVDKIRVFPGQAPVTFQYNGGGKLQVASYVFRAVTSGRLLRFSKRDTGRRFFVTRGRQ